MRTVTLVKILADANLESDLSGVSVKTLVSPENVSVLTGVANKTLKDSNLGSDLSGVTDCAIGEFKMFQIWIHI